jgi:putative exporter of polyketide antibiotics
MSQFALAAAVAALVLLVVLTELAAAALPLIIVITLVPPHERAQLAEVLAACDSSRKLRLWTALDAAVKVRRLRGRDDVRR